MGALPLIAGLDVATTTGLCFGLPGEPPTFETKRFAGEDRLAVASSAMRWAALRLREIRPEYVYIESPMRFGAAMEGKSNAKTLIRLNTLFDVIGGAAVLTGAIVVPVSVSDVRIAFIGEGRLDGDEAKKRCLAMCRLLGWPANNKDEGDAAAVWYYGSAVVAPRAATLVHPGLQRKAASIVAGEEIVRAVS